MNVALHTCMIFFTWLMYRVKLRDISSREKTPTHMWDFITWHHVVLHTCSATWFHVIQLTHVCSPTHTSLPSVMRGKLHEVDPTKNHMREMSCAELHLQIKRTAVLCTGVHVEVNDFVVWENIKSKKHHPQCMCRLDIYAFGSCAPLLALVHYQCR